MNEGKRGFKMKKHTVSLDKVKQRNPVAKNASSGIGGGAAGAHKDKKKAAKQGDTKHKKTPAEMLEGRAYERALELQLKIAVVESTIMERDPVAYAKAARSSINKNIGAGMMRDPSDPVRVTADRNIANRERGLGRQRARFAAKQPERDALAQQQAQQAIEADKANLPALTRELEQMEKRFNPNYEYADNHTVWSVNQSLEKQILALKNRIARAQGGQEEGYHVYSEFDGGKDEPYKYEYTGHTFGDRNSANLKAQELDDDLDYGGNQTFHRHIVKDRHPHVKGSVAEGFDAEYDDEAGMADNNIETMKRAVAGLDNLIQQGDNLPEWCQEKIAVSKSMLVAVWDYMASEESSMGEGSTPKDPKAPTQVKDRKTGKMYNPAKEFDKTMNSPEVKAQMQRMAQKESVAVLKQMIAEGKILDFLPPFKSMGRYVDDRRGNTIIEASDDGVAKELAGLLNKAFPPRQATGIAK